MSTDTDVNDFGVLFFITLRISHSRKRLPFTACRSCSSIRRHDLQPRADELSLAEWRRNSQHGSGPTRRVPQSTRLSTRLDTLLENEGIDVLVATSKHNVQYLLGGYR